VSPRLLMFYCSQILRIFLVALAATFLLPHRSDAQATSFTLTAGALNPAAVDPAGVATAVVTLGGDSSVGTVSLSCAVTSTISTTAMPTCLISPSAATPSATLSLTVTSLGATPSGQYSITITGTAGGTTVTSSPLFLNVVQAQQNYALTVTRAISPGSITAGGVATAIITITPISGYSGTVTLSCLSISPSVVASPYCTFQSNTTPSQAFVTVLAGTPVAGTLTINTFGTQQTTAELTSPRIFYTFLFGVPGLVLASAGSMRRAKRKFLAFFAALIVVALTLLLPACGGISLTSNNTYGYVTPKNTYMFTISGVDQNGVSPSNSGTQASISLTVN
jgi:hypothetical protein